MPDSTQARLTHNPITVAGVLLTTISAVAFLSFFLLDLFGLHANPYLGIIFFLILPAVFVFGLLLIPLGVWRERSRRLRGLPASQWRWPRLDLADPWQRRVTMAVAILTPLNLGILGIAAYSGLEYMDSAVFCGQVCHTVMQPEYTAYLDGPHARVRCVECHIGPGAPWFVKSKIDGVRQVWAVTFNTYSRPIPTPVHDLRPARDTCEHCHWPEKFTGDFVRTFRSFSDDEKNSEDTTTMQLHVGGGGSRAGGVPQGIHWHTSANHRVEYIAADDQRGTIPFVRLVAANGRVTEFVAKGADRKALQGRATRTMDCVDCHNRPSHRFAMTPARAVDGALAVDFLPRDLPFLHREAVAALSQSYPDAATAERRISERLTGFYRDQYKGTVAENDPRVVRAVAGVQRLFTHNVFPRMNVTWGTHPNHLGHTDSPGCFRCHDDEHAAPDGKTISADCELCHKAL